MDTSSSSSPSHATATDAGDAPPTVVVQFREGLVDTVVIENCERTAPIVIANEFAAASIQDMDSIEGVYAALQDVHDALMSLGAFNAVDIVLDEHADSPGKLSVKCTVAEKNVFGLQAGTYVQGDQGTIEASGHVRNVMGRCETIAATVEQGLVNNTYQASLTVPRLKQKPWHLDLKASQTFTSNAKWASYVERMRSASVTLLSEDGTRSAGYELGWRTLSDPSGAASPSIVAHLGESIKSAATLTFAANGAVTSIEVGGLMDYVKASVSSGVDVELSESAEIVIEGSAGVIAGGAARVCPSDRFHLGGIAPWGSMRAFHVHGVGPSDRRRKRLAGGRMYDTLGGTCLCSLFGALRFDLPSPLLQAVGMRGQVFLQAGVLENGVKQAAVLRNWRSSVGVGVTVPTVLGTLELNVCTTLKSKAGDEVKRGLQFGLTPL